MGRYIVCALLPQSRWWQIYVESASRRCGALVTRQTRHLSDPVCDVTRADVARRLAAAGFFGEAMSIAAIRCFRCSTEEVGLDAGAWQEEVFRTLSSLLCRGPPVPIRTRSYWTVLLLDRSVELSPELISRSRMLPSPFKRSKDNVGHLTAYRYHLRTTHC